MKTNTYLRFSLLIPFVIWGICLLLAMAMEAASLDQFTSELPEGISLGVAVFFTGYVLGIIFWILPYMLLGLILFFSTFISRAQVALKLFALSPLAMTLLTLATVIIMDSGSSGSIGQDFSGLALLVIALVLSWGYISVGIGYGIYRLLQRGGTIRDEVLVQNGPQPV